MFLLTSEYLHTHAVQSLDGCVFFSLVFCLWSAVMLSHRLPGIRHRAVVCDAGGGPAPPPLPPLFAQRGGGGSVLGGAVSGGLSVLVSPSAGGGGVLGGAVSGAFRPGCVLRHGSASNSRVPCGCRPSAVCPARLAGRLAQAGATKPPMVSEPFLPAPSQVCGSDHGQRPSTPCLFSARSRAEEGLGAQAGCSLERSSAAVWPGVNGVTFPGLFSRLDSGASGSDRSAGLGAD